MSLTAITALRPPAFGAATLTEALRERTWALHTEAERSGIINDILERKPTGTATPFCCAISCRPIAPWKARSTGIRANARSFTPSRGPSLRRPRGSRPISSALLAPIGSAIPVIAGGERYADRLAAAAEGDGGRLVAHAYVRYFGDLSGGQILKKLLGTALNLPPEALSFYEFPGIADPGDSRMRCAMPSIDDAAAIRGHGIGHRGSHARLRAQHRDFGSCSGFGGFCRILE